VTGTARDSSGNSSQCSFSVTVIGTPMNITDQPSSVTACPGGTATFIAAATGTLPITVVWQVDHGTGFTNIPNATNTTLTVPADPSTVGSYRAVFTNPCGSRASASATLSLGTSLSCSIDGPDFVCPNATAITYQAPGFKAYQWSISGDGTIVGSINAASVVVDAGPSGSFTLNLQVTDSTSCIGSCSKVALIRDSDAPVISCPANITVNAAPGECSSNVTFNVTATDNCAVTSLVSVPPSGFAFPVGITTVTNTARDSSGNSNRCTFTVTVVDTQLPVLSGLPNPSLRVQCLADVPSVPTVTANDNCDGNVTVIFTPTASGDVCNGTISRTWSAMDTSGNTATFTQTIIVHDDINPILIKGTIATSYATVAEAEAAAVAATGASDNCSAVTKTVSTVGDCPIVITVTGTDACGNHESVSYNTCVSVDLRLAIVRNDTSVTVSWPFPSTGFVLESTTNLSPANWQPVAEAPMVNNGRWEVTLPVDQQQRYLRLHKP
jgi:hypothetical protein